MFGNSVANCVVVDIAVTFHVKVVVVDNRGEVVVVPSVVFNVAEKVIIIPAGCVNLRGESLPINATIRGIFP